MATMVYANPGWTNGSPPALNKTNLDLLSNALASIGSAGSASVRDSDRVAGTVPAAGGVSLLGLSSLGASWLTALAAAATSGSANGIDAKTLAGTTPGARGLTALSQASTLDADTVSSAGIGMTSITSKNVSLGDTSLQVGGMYYCTYNAAYGFPTGVTEDSYLLVLPKTGSSVCAQILITSTLNRMFMRRNFGGFGAWYEIWNSLSDGNGGQPPAPKPKAYVSGLTQGEVTAVNLAGAASWTNPGGTWMYYSIIYTTATGALAGNCYANTTTGNISGPGGGLSAALFLWRIA